MKYSIYFSFLLTLALSACGGGGSDNQAPSAGGSTTQNSSGGTSNPPQTLAGSAQVIEYHGDSTVWGLRSNTQNSQVAKPAPSAFAEALPSSPRQDVRNRGVNGATACDLRDGNTTLGIETNWSAQMAASNATVIILNHGINDSNPGTGISLTAYTACLSNLADTAKARGKKVIFETPNPVDRTGLDAYVQAMKNVAAGRNIPVIDQYAYLSNKYINAPDAPGIRFIVPDGTHPSEEIYIEKGRFAATRFVTLPSNF